MFCYSNIVFEKFFHISVVYSAIGVLYMLYHYLVNEFVAKASSKNVENFSKVPVTIIVFGLTLTMLSLFHYFKNAALRHFAKKLFRHKIDSFRGALRRNVSLKPIPNWMSLNTLLAQPSLDRQTQNTKLFEKRTRRIRNVPKRSDHVDIVLEDISDTPQSPTFQS